MALPPDVDRLVQNQFASLLHEAEIISKTPDTEGYPVESPNGPAFHSLRTRFLSLLYLLSTQQGRWNNVISRVEKLAERFVSSWDIAELVGMITGLKSDYDAGMVTSLEQLIETNVASDYLGQAERLLQEGQPGKYDHVPAAVLTGAILEDALRRLCQRQTPPVSLDKPNGQPKTLNSFIVDLQKVNVYNDAKAKQLTAWAATRNHAAHGEFNDFTRGDVEQMLLGVQNFLADYL